MKLYKDTAMVTGNGRALDIPRAITVHNKQGCSTADHAIISHVLLHKVSYFKSSAPNQYSDHSLVQSKRNVQNENYCQNIVNEILNKEYLVNVSGFNDIGHDTTNLIKTVGNLSLKINKIKPIHQVLQRTIMKNKIINQLYQNMRKKLYTIGRRLMQFHRDLYLRGRFFKLKIY